MRTLLLGWGNPDRQDDGAAWHVLAEVARRSGIDVPDELGEIFNESGANLRLHFDLQLVPEIAELVSEFDRVAFIDAHTGSVRDDLNVARLEAGFQNSPLTHHLTPESVLDLARHLYGSQPEAYLVSIRGYSFGFDHQMSARTTKLVNQAADKLTAWLDGTSELISRDS